ncbi:MAG: hypothetical protein ACI9VR_003462 [Cognaticolwellia sp.]|jgi:hypothetical protein
MDLLEALIVALAGLFGGAIFFAAVRHMGSGLALATEPRTLVIRTRQRLLERSELRPAKGGAEGEVERGEHTLRFLVAEPPFDHLEWPLDLAESVLCAGLWGQLVGRYGHVWKEGEEHLTLRGLPGARAVELTSERYWEGLKT